MESAVSSPIGQYLTFPLKIVLTCAADGAKSSTFFPQDYYLSGVYQQTTAGLSSTVVSLGDRRFFPFHCMFEFLYGSTTTS